MKYSFQQSSLSLQLPLTAAACSLAVGLALIALAAVSSRHLQEAQQNVYGNALAAHLAQQVSGALETGDLLSLAATLQQFQGSSRAGQASIFDIEGSMLGRAGNVAEAPEEYRSEIRIGADIAGHAVVTVDAAPARESRQRFLISLSALAVILSLLVFVLTRYAAQRLAQRLVGVSGQLALEETASDAAPQGELALLEQRAAELPMELLKAHTRGASSREDHYRHTAVLYLHLDSLAAYVDTLNESNLHRYTDRLHRIVHAAAACYSGTLQVARQFGLIVCFTDEEGRGNALVRAAACAWLIRSVSRELEKNMTLSFSIGMAIGVSELGPGDSSDIYPGLYMQSVMDELRSACLDDFENIMLAPDLLKAPALTENARVRLREETGYGELGSFSKPQAALLDRQRELILNRLRGRSSQRP